MRPGPEKCSGPAITLTGLGATHAAIRDEIDEAIGRVIDGGSFILGEEVAAFEEEFAQYCEAEYCVGMASGTAALHLTFQALGIGPGDEVIAPANTFVATVMPLLQLGATPVLVDCDADTALIDVEAATAAITCRTKAVVAVHLYGQPADMEPLVTLATEHGIDLIEDAAQAHGARFGGRRVGALGRAGCFSFYPGKNLGALGDAGAVVTQDSSLAERLRLARHLGQARKYEHVVAGHNERLDALQAAVLRVKLQHLDEWNAARRQRAGRYREALSGLDLRLPSLAPGREAVWHLYVVRSACRASLLDGLAEDGIECGLHYPIPLHHQEALHGLGYADGAFPSAEALAREGTSLPMHPFLSESDIETVADSVRRTLASGTRNRSAPL